MEKCFNKIAIAALIKVSVKSSNKFRRGGKSEIETCCGIISRYFNLHKAIYFSFIGDFSLSEKIIKCDPCRRVCKNKSRFHSASTPPSISSPLFSIENKNMRKLSINILCDTKATTQNITKLISPCEVAYRMMMILNGGGCKKLTQSEQIFAQCFYVLNIVMIFVCEKPARSFDVVGEETVKLCDVGLSVSGDFQAYFLVLIFLSKN